MHRSLTFSACREQFRLFLRLGPDDPLAGFECREGLCNKRREPRPFEVDGRTRPNSGRERGNNVRNNQWSPANCRRCGDVFALFTRVLPGDTGRHRTARGSSSQCGGLRGRGFGPAGPDRQRAHQPGQPARFRNRHRQRSRFGPDLDRRSRWHAQDPARRAAPGHQCGGRRRVRDRTRSRCAAAPHTSRSARATRSSRDHWPGQPCRTRTSSSQLFSSVLAIHLSAAAEKATGGFCAERAGPAHLAGGGRVTLSNRRRRQVDGRTGGELSGLRQRAAACVRGQRAQLESRSTCSWSATACSSPMAA